MAKNTFVAEVTFNYPFLTQLFFLERDAPTATFVLLFILILLNLFLVLCFQYLHYMIFAFQQTWLSECFSLLSRHELLLTENFLVCFNVFIF